MVDLLKRYFAIEDRDGARAVREKLMGKLLTLDRAQEGSLPALLSLLDVPSEDPQWPTLDPPQRRRRTLDAVNGEIASTHAPLDIATAEGYYREAFALANDLGMRPLLAHCHLGLGKLYRRAADGVEAQEHLTTAATLYREMDMGCWLEKVEAEMAALR